MHGRGMQRAPPAHDTKPPPSIIRREPRCAPPPCRISPKSCGSTRKSRQPQARLQAQARRHRLWQRWMQKRACAACQPSFGPTAQSSTTDGHSTRTRQPAGAAGRSKAKLPSEHPAAGSKGWRRLRCDSTGDSKGSLQGRQPPAEAVRRTGSRGCSASCAWRAARHLTAAARRTWQPPRRPPPFAA